MKISFSHDYPKLRRQVGATLISVISNVDYSEFTDELLEYDTIYYDDDGKHYYELKPGKYIVLVFIGEKLIPFTTIRPYNVEKSDYYKSNIGNWFDIHIKGN